LLRKDIGYRQQQAENKNKWCLHGRVVGK